MFTRKSDSRSQPTAQRSDPPARPRRLDISNEQSWPQAAGRTDAAVEMEINPKPAAAPGQAVRNSGHHFADRFTAQRTVLIDGTSNRQAEETIISSDLTIIGNVVSKGNVRLEGTIEGDMNCACLTVSETGEITGSIIAEEVSVHGRVSGTVHGRSVQLFATAHVEGDIHHQGIGIEMGTHYDGRLKWSNKVPGAEFKTASGSDGVTVLDAEAVGV